MSMNYWYVARANELFLDIDNVSKSIKHAKSRLQGAIECGKLDVAYVMSHPSKNKNHIHAIVMLQNEMFPSHRFVWEIILHGDIYRGCCNIMRDMHNMRSPDILISPFDRFAYLPDTDFDDVRWPDDSCNCKTKHNRATMETCPAAKRLRGEFRTHGFFGKPSKNPCTIWPDNI
jgi:hypothetical protein